MQSAGYAELQKPTGLGSDHFNFHILRLVELGLVEKLEKGYRLTLKGKEYANKLDTDNKTIERQPKVAVLLAVERLVGGQKQLLFQERLKNPYFGYWGFASGKIRWGETIHQAASRELMEETGLTATTHILGLYHEHTYLKETNELLEDKMFYVVHCVDVEGDLVVDFEGGHNAWMTMGEARKLEKKFTSFETELEMIEGKQGIWVEQKHYYSKDEF